AYCLIKGIRQQQDRWLAGAAAFACLATMTRVTGLILPLVMLAALVLHAGSWGRALHRWSIPAIAFVALIILTASHSSFTVHRTDLTWIHQSPETRLRNLKYGVLGLYQWVPVALVRVAGTSGVLLLPWMIGAISRPLFRRAALILVLVFTVVMLVFI